MQLISNPFQPVWSVKVVEPFQKRFGTLHRAPGKPSRLWGQFDIVDKQKSFESRSAGLSRKDPWRRGFLSSDWSEPRSPKAYIMKAASLKCRITRSDIRLWSIRPKNICKLWKSCLIKWFISHSKLKPESHWCSCSIGPRGLKIRVILEPGRPSFFTDFPLHERCPCSSAFHRLEVHR